MSRTKRQTSLRWHRRVRTAQEIRENEAARLEGFRVRRVGKKSKPPTSYEDPLVAAQREIDFKRKKGAKRAS